MNSRTDVHERQMSARTLVLTLIIPLAGACGTLYYGEAAEVVYVDATGPSDDAGAPPGEDVPSVDVFYDELEHYGAWEYDDTLGYVFSPYDAHYVPYSEGHWTVTEYGLTWVSTDPIGWAVTHYGRWLWRDRWLWVPDTTWGPAWVQWRVTEREVGWAPLGVGHLPATMPYWGWRFVPRNELFAPRLAAHYYRERRLHRSIHASRPVHRWLEAAGRHYVVGPVHDLVGHTHSKRLAQLPMRRVGRVFWSQRPAERARRPVQPRVRGYRASPATGSRFSRAGLAREEPPRYRPTQKVQRIRRAQPRPAPPRRPADRQPRQR